MEWKGGSLCASSSNPSSCKAASAILTQRLDDELVSFAHFVAHSWGAHLAMHFSFLEPDRAGCIVLIDTPVINHSLYRNVFTEKELQAAKRDPNLTPEDVDAIHKQLLTPEALKVDEDDQSFDVISKVDVENVLLVQNPMLILRPEKGCWIDEDLLQLHKDAFNVKHDVVVKGCGGHEELFSPQHAQAVAAAIRQFLLEYDTQHDVESRIEKYRILDVDRTKAVRTKGDSQPAKAQQSAEAKGSKKAKAAA
eukprot:EG_transcript_18807